ncbi:MAG TPA: DUF4383 domain-containing protein [Thermoanaerobaculia bacterium]|nr:DUF4383 domain-containing protein [Thermoanaerobaculia bacterium]
MSAKQFGQIFGVILLLVGVVGLLVPSLGPLQFTMHHNLIHLLSGAVLAWAGFAGSASAARTVAQVFGVVYGLVTVWGFLGNAHLGPVMLHLNPAYNVIHLVVAALALWAGFGRRQ